jgi:dihydroorotase
MPAILIKNISLVNEGKIHVSDVFMNNGRIERIDPQINKMASLEVDGTGKYLLPGIIDDQVHFREPGLTHKATIYSESRAAVAGGTTSFMEMPNTVPNTLTQKLLEDKYRIGARTSLANYSFYMGVSNDNYDEVMRTPMNTVCGIKIFMGSSTGNMLVDDENVLEKIFASTPKLIAAHCESETIIKANLAKAMQTYGEDIPVSMHPMIRSEEACYASSSHAVEIAKRHNTRLHVFHLSTAKEIALFDNKLPLEQKRITSEICVHHLFFDEDDYGALGNKIKCNPAIKEKHNKQALFEAMLDDRLDVIATDHAPHTLTEKQGSYSKAPSGLPLVQHSLHIMLDFYRQGRISLERIVEKMCHAPAKLFRIKDRGFLREGYYADAFILDLEASHTVTKDNIFYKCGWSPLEGYTLPGKVHTTFVNGNIVYAEGSFDESSNGMRLLFNEKEA